MTTAVSNVASSNILGPGMSLNVRAVRAGKYNVTVDGQRVRVQDSKTGKWITVQGGQYLRTGDGDRARFDRGNLTFRLDDGTKITVRASQPNAMGVTTIAGVDVMSGGHAYRAMPDASGNLAFTRWNRNSSAVDASVHDGTVLHSRGSLDDLFRANGTQLNNAPACRPGRPGRPSRPTPTPPWCGTPRPVPTTPAPTTPAPVSPAPSTPPSSQPQAPSTPGPTNSIPNLLGIGESRQYEGLMNQINRDYESIDGLLKQLDNPNLKEGDRFRITTQIQQLQSRITLMTSLISNLMRTSADTARAIIQNVRA